MAKKGRLTSIEDPTLAIIGMGGEEKEDKAPVKKPVTKTPAKKVEKPVKFKEQEAVKQGVPELMKRPEKERLTKRFMILLQESLYIRLFNASVEADKSLNKYILDVLTEYADKNGL